MAKPSEPEARAARTRRLILGTAGHIDHGKTALVRVLTGVDTDRLAEEKRRGITIDLGFAELPVSEELAFGVVDVPGHESFVRNMLAGATGMDLVLLAVAADEATMPQTREHLAIVRLLGVERLVVALTRIDLVEEEWLELATEDVRDLLAGTPYADAPIVPTSALTGAGLDDLRAALAREGEKARARLDADVVRLPVDRVFTVRGTGTVATGTLWSGSLALDQRVRLEPGGMAARVRGIELHGRPVETARAGERTAVALVGGRVGRETVGRGQVVVGDDPWMAVDRVTARIELLPDTAWGIERGQRVRVHLGTAEAMARVFLLDRAEMAAGESAWAQLRLEAPLVARARDRVVLRSYSPVTTIGGGIVVEPSPPPRTRLRDGESLLLEAVLGPDPRLRRDALLDLAGWAGVPKAELPIRTGDPPQAASSEDGVAVFATARALYSGSVAAAGRRLLRRAVARHHGAEPLRPGMPLAEARGTLPRAAGPELADALLAEMAERGALEVRRDLVREPGFAPSLTEEQEGVRSALAERYRAAGLSPPSLRDLPAPLRDHPDLWPILKLLERAGDIVALGGDLFADAGAVERSAREVRSRFGGRSGLGPADFREVLPVTRRHLLPLLAWFDRTGVTVRRGDGRNVPVGGETLS